MRNRRFAFTLIEVLTVSGIILILAALILPSLSAARQKAKVTVKTSQLRQLSRALLEYSMANDGGLPPFPYGYGTEWHNVILSGTINKTALDLANPDKADTRTKTPFSFHIGYAIN